MKILVLSAQFPYPPRSGFETRVYQLTRALAERHEVTLLSYSLPEEREDAAKLGVELPVQVVEREASQRVSKRVAQIRSIASSLPYACREAHSREMQAAIDGLCARHRFDVIQVESSLLCTFDLPVGPKVLLDEHNIEYEVLRRVAQAERSIVRRAYNAVEHARYRRFEQRAWKRVDGCMVTSERESEIVRDHAPHTPVVVVPNGVDLNYFRPTDRAVEPDTAVFNGVLDYRPNLDAARYLVSQIWPLVQQTSPRARLKIVGRASAAEARGLDRPGVVLAGEVPDVRPHLEQAAVVLVPIRMGGGTRLKVLDGLALGKAIVSTSLGCEGIAVRPGKDLLVADDARGFADAILAVFSSESLARALGRNGRALVERQYSWELARLRVQSMLDKLATDRGADR